MGRLVHNRTRELRTCACRDVLEGDGWVDWSELATLLSANAQLAEPIYRLLA
jgi:hypothetical protein